MFPWEHSLKKRNTAAHYIQVYYLSRGVSQGIHWWVDAMAYVSQSIHLEYLEPKWTSGKAMHMNKPHQNNLDSLRTWLWIKFNFILVLTFFVGSCFYICTGGHKWASDFLEMEFQVDVRCQMWVLGTKPWPSARPTNAESLLQPLILNQLLMAPCLENFSY